jgi:hypothetical protein
MALAIVAVLSRQGRIDQDALATVWTASATRWRT